MNVTSNTTATIIDWAAPSQDNISWYKIYKLTANNTASLDETKLVAMIPHCDNPFFIDIHRNLGAGGTRWYYLKSVSWAGKSSSYSNCITAERTSGISISGNIDFGSSGGLTHGMMSVNGNAVNTDITAVSTITKFTGFDTNGNYINTSPDHTNDLITILSDGTYLINCTIILQNPSTSYITVECDIYKNNGSASITGLSGKEFLFGNNLDTRSMCLTGIANLTASTTIELWVQNQTSDKDFLISDCSLSLLKIGGI